MDGGTNLVVLATFTDTADDFFSSMENINNVFKEAGQDYSVIWSDKSDEFYLFKEVPDE